MVTIAERFIFSEVSDPDSFVVSDTWMDEPFPIAYCTDPETAKELAADLNENQSLRARIAELEAERAELVKDAVRLMQYDSLRRNFTRLIKSVLGDGYYNMGMDVYECDRLACEDIARKANETWFARLRGSIRRAIDQARGR